MAGGHGEKLGRKQEPAIAALLAEPSVEAAARKVGVDTRTLQRWLTVPTFAAAYRAARLRVVENALGRLQAACGEAVDALRQALHGDHPGARVRAALGILSHSIRAVEVGELLARIEELERHAAGAEPPADESGALAVSDPEGVAAAEPHPPGPGGGADVPGSDAGPVADGPGPLFG
jgi:hypothetical protein